MNEGSEIKTEMNEAAEIRTEADEAADYYGNVDLMQTQYVKVATEEVAMLIRAVCDYKVERENLLAKCQSMERIISHRSLPKTQGQIVSGPVGFRHKDYNSGSAVPHDVDTMNNDSQTTTLEKKVPVQDLQEQGRQSMPSEQKSFDPKSSKKSKSPDVCCLKSRGSGSIELSSVGLEEDCVVEEPTVVDLRRGFRSAPDLAPDRFAYDEASIERTLSEEKESTTGLHVDIFNSFSSITSSSSVNPEPIRHPSIHEDVPVSSGIFQIGVSQQYFDCAIEELEKVKKENSFYKRTVVSLEQQLLESQNRIQELQTSLEKQKHFDQLRPSNSTHELFSSLSKKLNQQEKRIGLNKMAIDQLNKQCELWREKYRHSDAENQNLARRIASLIDQEKRYVDFGVQTEMSSDVVSLPGMPHFEMLKSENTETSHNTKLLTDTTHQGLDNSAFLIENDVCNLELSTDRFNLTAQIDFYNQKYETVQNENEDLKWKLDRNQERLERVNYELFEERKLLNAIRDASFQSSSTSGEFKLTSMPCQNSLSRESAIQRTIKFHKTNSNDISGAMSELFYDEKKPNDSDESTRRYNSDTTIQNIHNAFATNSL